MTLLFEVLGIVIVAVVIRALLPAQGFPLPAAVAAVAVALAGAAFWLQAYPDARKLFVEHEKDESTTREAANVTPGGLFPADEGFMEWAAARLPKTARVWLECAGHCPGEWVTFRLAPRVFVNSLSQAEYVLFYDISPSSVAFARGKPLAVFAPTNTSNDAEFVKGQEAIATLCP